MARVWAGLAGLALGLGPVLVAADHRGGTWQEVPEGPVMTVEVYDACALDPDGDAPLPFSGMTPECQAVFEPCHLRLHLAGPLETPDLDYVLKYRTELEYCLFVLEDRLLLLLAESHQERLRIEANAGAQGSGAGRLAARPCRLSARSGSVCEQRHGGGRSLGYLQCLNDGWNDVIHDTRILMQEGSE